MKTRARRHLRPMRPRMSRAILGALPLLVLAFSGPVRAAPPDAIVAADGSGQYRSIQEAISVAPHRTNDEARWTIFVKAGSYHERVYVQRERGYITLIGEDAARTILVYDRYAGIPGPDGKPINTFRTPTLQVDGDRFEVQNLTIANSAGPVGQALALRADGDRLVFRRCRFLGWQDTILVNRGRHYFEDCTIEGHVDFIFGGATAFFSRCHIHCLGDGYITAASTPEGAAHGFVFSECRITGGKGTHTYLGRPWRPFARTVFLRTDMSDVVRPEGWNNWNKPAAERTCYYAEFGSYGPGAKPEARVPWAKSLTAAEAAAFTPASVLGGDDGWNPAGGPTLHLCGDSTMADKPDPDYPERGWGQLFRQLVQPPLRVVNHAVNGRSTKSFRDEGRWQHMLDMLVPGDWVLIQFGHNDEKSQDPKRYADPVTDFPANLRRFVTEVREHGANPILATPVVRRLWDEHGVLTDSHGAYLTAVRQVAATEHVPLLDMESATRALETKLGPEGSKQLHMIFAPGENPRLPDGKEDNTHYVETGARLVAALAAREMRRLKLPFAVHLKKAEVEPEHRPPHKE